MELGVVPSLEGDYWHSEVDPQLEDPTEPLWSHCDTHSTIVGSEEFQQPSQTFSQGFTKWHDASNEHHYETHGTAKQASEQLLCFGMVRTERSSKQSFFPRTLNHLNCDFYDYFHLLVNRATSNAKPNVSTSLFIRNH